MFGFHQWSGCVCTSCGKTRDQEHDWSKECEKCAKCGKRRINGHTWNGCKCEKCGEKRDENHTWGPSRRNTSLGFGSDCNCEKCNTRAFICSCGQVFTFSQLRRAYTRMGAKSSGDLAVFSAFFGGDTGLVFNGDDLPTCPKCRKRFTEKELLRIS